MATTQATWFDVNAEKARTRVLAAVTAVAAGRMVVVTDDADRENEGDLVMAADAVTAQAVNFMVVHGRGLVCLPMEGHRLDALGLRMMVANNSDPLGTGFTISVDVERPGSTGISAFDRAETIRALLDPDVRQRDLRTPGHVFPLRYAEGGVLVRRGHTEASVDLARLAGRAPAGLICEILAPDGTMLRGAGLTEFAAAHSLPVVTIEELVAYRLSTEGPRAAPVERAILPLAQRAVETTVPTRYGSWRALGYVERASGIEHMALVLGAVEAEEAPLVRIHSECFTGDVLGSQRCDCGQQLDHAFRAIADQGSGVIIYVRGHEGRGIGLVNKLRAYALQDGGLDTVDANVELNLPVDARSYEQSVAILQDLGVSAIRLLTNNPEKLLELRAGGITVIERVPAKVQASIHNAAYLSTKQNRMAHSVEAVTPEPRLFRSHDGDSRIVS